jgi:hypothetical protein
VVAAAAAVCNSDYGCDEVIEHYTQQQIQKVEDEQHRLLRY